MHALRRARTRTIVTLAVWPCLRSVLPDGRLRLSTRIVIPNVPLVQGADVIGVHLSLERAPFTNYTLFVDTADPNTLCEYGDATVRIWAELTPNATQVDSANSFDAARDMRSAAYADWDVSKCVAPSQAAVFQQRCGRQTPVCGVDRTPDLSHLVMEVLALPEWQLGNSVRHAPRP